MNKVDIRLIKPNPKNPRTITANKFKKLVKSIQDFPEMLNLRPIVVDNEMVVLGGNMRLKACIEAGLTEVPIIVADQLTEQQKAEFVIKDNVGFGEWDWDVLANEWAAQDLDDWGLDLPVEELEEGDAQDDHYEIPEDIQSIVKPGDVIEIGPHRLVCGDSTKPEDAEKLANGQRWDMVLTDPPYNVDYEGSNGMKIMNDKMSDDKFYNFLQDAFQNFARLTKAGGAWYVFHSDNVGVAFRQAFTNSGLLLKQCLIWVKNALVLGRQDYQWRHEPILYGWKAGAGHYFVDERTHDTVFENEVDLSTLKKEDMLKILQEFKDSQGTIIRQDKPKRNDVHPTMKPIPLMALLIKNSTVAGELVADPFLGSGSTMVASHQIGRICYGMELDPKYCQVIIERMHLLDEALEIKINGKPWAQN